MARWRGPEAARSLPPGPSDRAVGAPGFTARPRCLGAPAPPAAGTRPPASSIPVHSNDQHTPGGNWALGRRQPAMPPGIANQTRPPERGTEELTTPSRQLGPRGQAQSRWAPRRPQQSAVTSLTFRVIAGSQQPENDPGKTQDSSGSVPHSARRWETLPGADLAFRSTRPHGDKGPTHPPDGARGWKRPKTGRRMVLRQALLSRARHGDQVHNSTSAGQTLCSALSLELGMRQRRRGSGGSQPLHQGRLHLNTWARGDCCGRPASSSLSPETQGTVKSASTQTKGLLLSHLSPQMGTCHPEKPRFRRHVGAQGHALVRQEPRARPGP